MSIVFKKGDIFTSTAEALVNPVNKRRRNGRGAGKTVPCPLPCGVQVV